jgi:hypothetical protein
MGGANMNDHIDVLLPFNWPDNACEICMKKYMSQGWSIGAEHAEVDGTEFFKDCTVHVIMHGQNLVVVWPQA